MKKLITLFVLIASLAATAQGKFEEGMGKAFELWKQGKNEEASAMFERIASAEKNSWLPNYYVALINTISAFQTTDKDKVGALLTKAQTALDTEMDKDQVNAELLVMQAMIHIAYIASDPMTYGMTLSGKVMELYTQAQVIAPENPRVIFGKAEFEIGGARYFGTDTKLMYAQIDKAIALFAKFKPASEFHPKWGLDRALEAQKECKK